MAVAETRTVREVEMPPGVAALERDPRGYPKFFLLWPPEGHPFSFKVLNPAMIVRCGRERRCGICGEGLPYRFVFIGTVEDARERIFAPAPFCRPCALYALAVCPFLVARYEPSHAEPADPHFRKFDGAHATPPEVIVVWETRGIKRWGPMGRGPNPTIGFIPEAATSLEFYWPGGHRLDAEAEKEVRYALR